MNHQGKAETGGRHLLQVEDLCVQYQTSDGVSRVVDGVSFHVDEGETLGIVGESGCGKSTTALGVLRLVPTPGRIAGGRVLLDGIDLVTLSGAAMRQVRGHRISMILQDPMTALNPAFAIGAQVGEAVAIHEGLRGKTLRTRVIELLNLVRIPAAAARLRDYPHQLSGGMRQRVAGAIGIASSPRVLICDEPTTALDVTIQAQYLDLLEEIQERTGVALIFITHDMGIVNRMCDRTVVMYAGRVVEAGPTREVLLRPAHPYTAALLNCLPDLDGVERLESIEGQPPDPRRLPHGCRFAPRCPAAQAVCTEAYPAPVTLADGREVACFFPGGSHDV